MLRPSIVARLFSKSCFDFGVLHRAHFEQAEPHNWRKTFAPRIVALTCAAHVPLLALALAAELVEQRLGFLQIGGIEALGEPGVDFGQHRARFVAATLLREQPREACCRA